MLAEFAKMADAEAVTLPWVDAEHREVWRATADAEFARRLHEVARFEVA